MDERIYWLQDETWIGEGGIFYRAFDLIKFIEKVEDSGKKVIGIKLEGNNLELITIPVLKSKIVEMIEE